MTWILVGLIIFFMVMFCLFTPVGFWLSAAIVMIILICIVFVCSKLKEIKDYFENKSLYKSLKKNKTAEPISENLKQLFVLSSKEILIGERVMATNGATYKKISSIKDAPTKIAAQNNADLSFAIDKTNGKVYKILKLRENDDKYYYEINFSELNRYLEMSASAHAKYKRINSDNWKQICNA